MNTLFTVRISKETINAKVRRGAAGKGRTSFAMRSRINYMRHARYKNKTVD
jgi:hypothetical protein